MMKLSCLAILATTMAQSCDLIAGNYYCDQTSVVQYENIGSSGSYNRVTSFNSDGTCSSQPQGYSGPLAPFDEELSVHFRGPIQLEHFRVFTKSEGQAQKKRALHHRHAEPEPVYVTATDYTTAYVTVGAGSSETTSAAVKPVSSSEAAPGPAGAAAPTSSSSSAAASPPSNTPETSSEPAHVFNYNYNHEDQTSVTGPSVITRTTSSEPATSSSSSSASSSSASSSTSSASSSSSSSAPQPSGSAWSQIASYDAGAGSANGLVFLNNLGGGGSGVFDYTWGNSLSYAGSDGVSCASSPQTLSQTTVPSNKEFIIFTDNECGNGGCGYTRPGTVAYHGFDGAYKVFVFEFSMPTDHATGFNADMPSVWLLNAQIPRTLQYGEASCSCWKSGCGELDLFEVLNAGNNRLTNSVHDNHSGGTGNYFARPTQGTLKAAAVFDGSSVSIVEIPEIPDSIDDGTIQSWLQQAGTPTKVQL